MAQTGQERKTISRNMRMAVGIFIYTFTCVVWIGFVFIIWPNCVDTDTSRVLVIGTQIVLFENEQDLIDCLAKLNLERVYQLEEPVPVYKRNAELSKSE